jgi:hypothetical protein
MKKLAIVLFDEVGSSTGGSIQQVYASLGESNGNVIAANLPSLWSGRSVLIENIDDGKFAIKTCDSSSTLLTVVGKGGRDKKTGELKEGYYWAAVKESSAEYSACVDNQTQVVVEDSNCTEIAKIATGELDLANYLGLTSSEKKDLAGFTDLIGASGQLTTDDCPQGDSDKNWPAKIQVK